VQNCRGEELIGVGACRPRRFCFVKGPESCSFSINSALLRELSQFLDRSTPVGLAGLALSHRLEGQSIRTALFFFPEYLYVV
jgi:hypothetical protein